MKYSKELKDEFERILNEIFGDVLDFSYCDEPIESVGQFYLDGRLDMAWKLFLHQKGVLV